MEHQIEKNSVTLQPNSYDYGSCLILTVVYSNNAANGLILRFESADETEMTCQGITVSNIVTYRRESE